MAKGIEKSVLLAINAEINEIIVCITGVQMLIKLAMNEADMLEEDADEAG